MKDKKTKFPNILPHRPNLLLISTIIISSSFIIGDGDIIYGKGYITQEIKLGNGEVKIQGGKNGYVLPDEGEQFTIIINPFETGIVDIKIYNVFGQIIWYETKSVESNIQLKIPWACKTIDNKIVTAGIYFVRIKGAGINYKGKVAVIR